MRARAGAKYELALKDRASFAPLTLKKAKQICMEFGLGEGALMPSVRKEHL